MAPPAPARRRRSARRVAGRRGRPLPAEDGRAGGTFSCADSLSNAYAPGPGIADPGTTTAPFFFTYRYASAPGPVTVTVTDSSTASQQRFQLAPRVLTGAAASQAGAGHIAASGATINQPFTTTQAGSPVNCMASMGSVYTVTPVSGTTAIDTLADSGNSGDTGAIGVYGPSGAPGSVSIGWSPGYGSSVFVALEILPAAGGPAVTAPAGLAAAAAGHPAACSRRWRRRGPGSGRCRRPRPGTGPGRLRARRAGRRRRDGARRARQRRGARGAGQERGTAVTQPMMSGGSSVQPGASGLPVVHGNEVPADIGAAIMAMAEG